MTPLLAGAFALVILIVAFRGIAAADPAALARGLRMAGAIVLGAGAALLLVSGRLVIAGAMASAALALIGWTPSFWSRFSGRKTGRRSEVETELLRMTLDHESGVMTGQVRKGRFAGRFLAELSQDELFSLLDEARLQDPDAAALIETWLDRLGAPDWRADYERRGGTAGTQATGGVMTRDEAYKILGVAAGASEEDIRQAHRRLMRNFHPDAGGSTYLASKINQAKDLLLG